MRYLRRTLNYSEIIALSNSSHMRSMAVLGAIDVETPRIDRGCDDANPHAP